jgi:DNA replication protein DnaC
MPQPSSACPTRRSWPRSSWPSATNATPDLRSDESRKPSSPHQRLADFDIRALPDLPPATLAHLASGTWIDKGEPLVLLGDSGTGKTHLLIALGTAAAEQGRRVRYVTTAALVNELVEAADDKELSRVVGRYARLDLLCLDKLG